MQLSKKEGTFAILAGVGGFLLLSGLAVYDHIAQANYAAQNHSGAAEYDGPKWTDVALTVYTYVLSVSTIGMWYLMHRQRELTEQANDLFKNANETAVSALKEAQSANVVARNAAVAAHGSNAILIESQRGTMAHFRTIGVDKDWWVHYAFKNIGPGPVVVTEVQVHMEMIVKGARIQGGDFDKPWPPTYYPLASGDIMSTKKFKGASIVASDGAGIFIREDWRDRLNTTHDLAIQYRFLFTSLMGYKYEHRYTIAMQVPQKTFTAVNDPRLTFERNLD